MANRKIDYSWIALSVSIAFAIGVMVTYWIGWLDRTKRFEPFEEETASEVVQHKSSNANDFNVVAARKSIVYIKCLVPGLPPMFGTGFLVSPDGLIYTNRHVVKPEQPIKGSIVLVGVPSAANPGVLDFFKAEVVHATPTRDPLDFAILKVAAKENYGRFPALPLTGDSVDLASPVAVLGYPFITSDQRVLAFNRGSISATRVELDKQAYYQTDAAVNPGNSGGPLLNLRGEAIGIVTKRKTNAIGMNYALQLKEVQTAAALAKRQAADLRPEPGPLDPRHIPSLPSIPPDRSAWEIVRGDARVQPGILNIHNDGGPYWIATKDDLPENFQVVMTCQVEFMRGRQQVFPLHNDIRRSLFIRFGTENIKNNIMDSVGTRLQFRDHDMVFWQENLFLNGPQGSPDDVFVLTISRQRGVVTVAVDKDIIFRSVTSAQLLSPTKLSIGGILSQLNLGEVSIMEIEPGPPPPKYHPNPNKAKFDPLVMGNFGPPILIPPNNPPPLIAIDVPELASERVEIPIGSKIADAAGGGGGRFLVLHLPDRSELAVFDVSLAKVVRTIRLAEANAKFAVGLDKVVVVLPASKRIERYNLLNADKREQVASLATKEPMALATMGSASRGPILLGAGTGMNSELVFIDVHTLKPLNYTRAGQWQIAIDKNSHIRASADGSVFAASGNGVTTLAIAGNEVHGYFTNEHAGHAVPGPDGRFIHTLQGLFARDLKPLGKFGRDQFTLPAAEGKYSLRFDRNAERAPSDFLHITGDERPIAPVGKDWLADVDLNDRGSFPGDKRVYFIPSAKVIVTIPNSNDKVVLHRFDADEALEKSGLDYLYVTSLPPIWGRKGATYRYPIAVRSRSGGLKYSKITGPTGMTVSKAGEVTWAVPALYPDHECEVVIAVSDATGREVQHAFKIALQDQPAK